MRLSPRSLRTFAGATLALALTGAAAALPAQATAATPNLVSLSGSLPGNENAAIGAYSSAQMSIEVVLSPRDAGQLQAALQAAYTPGNAQYQQWLAQGQFDARYAPSAATEQAVTTYLHDSGLTITPTSSPFLVRAAGSSSQVTAALHTSLATYRSTRGTPYYANDAAVRLPQTLSGDVLGVLGLTDTAGLHSALQTSALTAKAAPSGSATLPACETPYPTRQTLYSVGGAFESGYGGGPHCSGLTPQQVDSIYGAPHIGPRGAGAGVTLAVFEQSAYQESDITTWAHQYYGPNYTPPVNSVLVDGGNLDPQCPAGDDCPAVYQGYLGDVEVDADVEEQLTVSPDAAHLLVYDAPYDTTGETALDEYTAMADQDRAAVVSESWGNCEPAAGTALVQAESIVFEQMALQGQSLFGSSGDSGAFDCLDENGSTGVSVDDPPSQPWVTSVGGASWENFDPGADPHPGYPTGVETALNVDNLCNTSPDEGGQSGYFWCANAGSGGGGNSQYWGRPFYQQGPGVQNPYSTRGNGTTQCALAALGAPCRETPDVSANADQFTAYSEYCTGNASTPNSVCANIPASLGGWFPVGGTSLSSPLWSGIIADRDGFLGHRTGNFNPLAYRLYQSDPQLYFHDITGIGPLQSVATNNGVFPTTSGYDMATGIGTPKMAALITLSGAAR